MSIDMRKAALPREGGEKGGSIGDLAEGVYQDDCIERLFEITPYEPDVFNAMQAVQSARSARARTDALVGELREASDAVQRTFSAHWLGRVSP